MTDTGLDWPLPARKSLRAKAWFATLALLVYLAASSMYIALERGKIFASVQQLEALAQHEKALALAEASVTGALIDASESSSAAVAEPASPDEMRLYMETCNRLLSALQAFDPSYASLYRAIDRSFGALQALPVRANWIDLRETLSRTADELDHRRVRLTAQREALTTVYQRKYDAVTVESLVLAAIGLLVFGSVTAWFFTRLAGDVQQLEAHARQIIRGGRGVTMAVRREDELGRLMHAVNQMSADLDERDKQIELDGQRRSHQDKMLAVGALAAGVAHEVNNPLAVISGLAEEIKAAAQAGAPADKLADSAQMIVVQAQRAAQVARHLAESAALQPAELDWVDLKGLLQRVVQLMGYDRRYRSFGFQILGEDDLPAVRTSAHAVQQVLMQMLAMGCDAMVDVACTPAQVQITTAARSGAVEVGLRFPLVLDFSRSDVQRSLVLSRAIVEPVGARLAFDQDDGPLLRITLTLPSTEDDLKG